MPILVLVWVRPFIGPDVLKTYCSNTTHLSDQSALKISVRIWVRLGVVTPRKGYVKKVHRD